MKRVIIMFLLIVLLSPMRLYCQNQKNKDVNITIVIDEHVAIDFLSSFGIIDGHNDLTNKAYRTTYIPGKLSLASADFKKITSGKDRTVFLFFNYQETFGGFTRSYKIELNRGFLQWPYTVLYIYNLDKKQYQGLFTPDKGCNYVFEVRCSEFSALLIRNVDIK